MTPLRTPTAVLRLASALGSQSAQASLSARKANQRLDLDTVRNGPSHKAGTTPSPRTWADRLGIDSGARVQIPRVPLHLAADPRASAPASIASRLESIVTTKATSWLHHGFGAPASKREAPGVPSPAPAKSELHPLGLLQQNSSADAPKSMSTLDRQAHALIQGEKDLSTFFGEVDSDDAVSVSSARSGYLAKNAQVEQSMVSLDYGTDRDDDAVSITSMSDIDSGDEWEYLTPEEHAAADARYTEEERAIAALDREFFGSQYPGSGASDGAKDLRASIRGQSSDQNVANALMDAARKTKDTAQAFEYNSDSGDESDSAEPDGLDEVKLHANQHQRYMERSSAKFEAEFQKLFATPNAESRAKAPEPATDGTGGKPEKNADVADMRVKLMADIRAAAAERNARMDPTATAALEPQATQTSRSRGETLLLDIFNEMNSRHKLTKDSGSASDIDSDDDDSGNHTDRSEASFSDGSISD